MILENSVKLCIIRTHASRLCGNKKNCGVYGFAYFLNTYFNLIFLIFLEVFFLLLIKFFFYRSLHITPNKLIPLEKRLIQFYTCRKSFDFSASAYAEKSLSTGASRAYILSPSPQGCVPSQASVFFLFFLL